MMVVRKRERGDSMCDDGACGRKEETCNRK